MKFPSPLGAPTAIDRIGENQRDLIIGLQCPLFEDHFVANGLVLLWRQCEGTSGPSDGDPGDLVSAGQTTEDVGVIHRGQDVIAKGFKAETVCIIADTLIARERVIEHIDKIHVGRAIVTIRESAKTLVFNGILDKSFHPKSGFAELGF